MSKKIVIIGGVAGGATAATRLRRLNEEDKIVLFEKGEYISFAKCGLPYHVKNRRNGTLFGFSVSTEIKVLMGIPA